VWVCVWVGGWVSDALIILVWERPNLCLGMSDSVPNIKLLRRLLVSVGLEVEVAENGQIALDVVRAHEEGDKQLPDLVLMDLQMCVTWRDAMGGGYE
jgi:CheY-like chemotaxis protein